MSDAVKRVIVRAVVTFVQVALGVIVAGELSDFSPAVLHTAAASGAGAALSVVFNAVTEWKAKLDADAEAISAIMRQY